MVETLFFLFCLVLIIFVASQVVKTREKNDRQALLSGMCSNIHSNSILEEVGLPKFAPILIIVPPSVAENWAVSKQTVSWHCDLN